MVVVPTYNEAETLPLTAAAIFEHLVCDLLVVDDNSPDGTGALADDLAKASDRVHVLHRTKKDGLGRAYVAGFSWALEQGYERVLQMDCDLSHPPDRLPDLVRASLNEAEAGKADLVLGSRYVPGAGTAGWAARRLLLSRAANFYARTLLGLPAKDCTGGYRCFRAELLSRIDLGNVGARGYGFQVEMLWLAKRAGARIAEVPIQFAERHAGESKMSFGIMLEGLLLVLKLRLGLGGRK
ncbi:MAG: polyprenol monophosphomannose synthase [Planctomycetota bacterium]